MIGPLLKCGHPHPNGWAEVRAQQEEGLGAMRMEDNEETTTCVF